MNVRRCKFVLSSNLVLATEWTKSKIVLCKSRSILVDFGRFRLPEGTETLILAFISKTGSSVEYFHLDFSTTEKIYLGIL